MAAANPWGGYGEGRGGYSGGDGGGYAGVRGGYGGGHGGYGRGHGYGKKKREADAEPVADAAAEADAYHGYGGYGGGYGGYGGGYGGYGSEMHTLIEGQTLQLKGEKDIGV